MIIRVPAKMKVQEIEKFLLKKKTWIQRKMQYRQDLNSKVEKNTFHNGGSISILGNKIPVSHKIHSSRRLRCELVEGEFRIFMPTEYNFQENKNRLKNKIIKWYKQFAKAYILTRIDNMSPKIPFQPLEVRIRTYKSRWGACREDGIIIFNWRIIQAPPKIIDYVIIHEMCHLKIMNHSKKYWNLVSKYHSDYKTSRKWLKENVLQLKFD